MPDDAMRVNQMETMQITEQLRCVHCEEPIEPEMADQASRVTIRCPECDNVLLLVARSRLGEVKYFQGLAGGCAWKYINACSWTPAELRAMAAHLEQLQEDDEPVFNDGSGSWKED